MATTKPRRSILPESLVPVLVRAAEQALALSDADGRLRFQPGQYNYLQDMTGIACLAALLVTAHPENPLYRSDRLADLIRRAGRFMVRHHLDPEMNPPGHMWYDGREIHEWAFELWLASYKALRSHGAADLTEGWDEGLRAGAECFFRWCREIEHVRTAISPNLSISPNHFAFFILNTLEAGLTFDLPEYRDVGLERAQWLTSQQDPDGYWPETDGPTTSYNFITTAAVGWYYELTGDKVFAKALRRALEFHTRYAYPDGCFLDVIDQRVRFRPYPGENWVWVQQAFSHFPEGRALNEFVARRLDDFSRLTTNGHRMGRLGKNLLHYDRGAVGALSEALVRGHYRLSREGGIVKDGTWAVGLCGIPSRPRPHRYTLDRANLVSVWHQKTGLILGGGQSRNHPQAATFHKRVPVDPQAVADGRTELDAYIPVSAALDLHDRGGTLRVGYWGFDADLTAEVLSGRRLRLTASAWGRKTLMPVLFTPNIRLLPGGPLVTGAEAEIMIDGTAFRLTADELGGWFGQGAWRITVPPGAVLEYPFRPYYPTIKPEDLSPDLLYGLLTVPISNGSVSFEVRVT